MSTSNYDENGILRQQWNDNTRQYSEWDADGVLLEGMPRPYTDEENSLADINATVEAQENNRQELLTKARTALTANANFLALASPTNAQVLAQVKMLTREATALIKLELNDLLDTNGT